MSVNQDSYQFSFIALVFTIARPSHLPGKSAIDIGRHCLKIPGRLLDLSTLLDKKKFRAFDNKDGALRGFNALQDDGLGCLEQVKRGKGYSKVIWLCIRLVFSPQHSCTKGLYGTCFVRLCAYLSLW